MIYLVVIGIKDNHNAIMKCRNQVFEKINPFLIHFLFGLVCLLSINNNYEVKLNNNKLPPGYVSTYLIG